MKKRLLSIFALVFCLLAGFSGTTAYASHLRGTSVSWSPTGNPGEVQFTILYSQRTSYNGCSGGSGSTCVLGGTVALPFYFGDGNQVNVNATITSLNAAEDYLSAVGTVTHTYATAGPFIAYYENSARVSTIKSGENGNLRMETLVSPMANPVNHSPVASMPAIVTVPLQATTGFDVSAADQDGDPLTFRLSTAAEMYDVPSFSCALQQPPGLSISNTGHVTWDTTQITTAGCGFAAPVSGDIWTVQFMVQDLDGNGNVKSKIPVDLIIKFVLSTEAPPTVNFSNPGPITAVPGTPISFTISAADPAPNARVTFNVTGLPIGATTTNTNQALTPPTSSTFNWTPTASQTGSYVVTYTVTNDTFEQVLSSVTINVPNAPPPVVTCSTGLTSQYNALLTVPLQVSDPQGEALTVVWSVDGTAVHTDNVAATAGVTTLSFAQTFADLNTHSVSVRATNTDNISSSCSTPVTMVPADQNIAFAATPMVYGSLDVVPGASSTSGLPISFTATGSCSIVSGAIHATGAGSCSVMANQAGNANYNAAQQVTQTFLISQAPLTVTATSATRQYAAANPTFTGTIVGLVGSDAVTATFASVATPTSPVGTYPIVPTLSGSALGNYSTTLVNGTLTVTAAAPAKLAASNVISSMGAGGNLGTLLATVQDAYGNTVLTSTAPVVVTITGPNGYSQTVTVPAVNGVARFSLSALPLTVAGNYTVTTSSAGLTGTSATVTVTAGTATKLSASNVISSLGSGGNLGALLSTVKDAYGNTVTTSTAAVTATITGPGGYSQTVAATAVNGVARFDLSGLPLNTAGNYTVTTNSSGLTGTSGATTVTPGPGTKIAANTVISSLGSGGNLGTLIATIQDASGNTSTSSTAAVTVTITGPNGYSKTITATAVNGVARFDLSGLPLNTAGNYTVTTSSSGLTGTSSATTVTPGPATKVAANTVISSLGSGGNLGALVATIEDANGNKVTSSTAAVTATITGPNGYSQTVTAAAVNGVARLDLSALPLNTAGNYTVTTSSSGLTGTSSATTVTPGTATKLAEGTVVSTVVSGGNLGTVAVTMQDANGNTVTSSSAMVTATITGPNGYSQTVSGAAVNGVASLNLSSLSLTTAGTYTVAMSSSGVTGASATSTVTPGAATKVVPGTMSTSITSGQTLGTLRVTVQDPNGNVATSYNGPVTATLTGPNGYSQTVTGTAVNGVVTLDLGSLTPSASGTYSLTLSGTSMPLSVTPIVVAPAAQTVALPSPTSVTFGAGATSLPTTTSAGLPITYTVTGPAVLNGSTVTVTGAGTVTITATQAGDASHSPVVATTTMVVAQAPSTTTLSTSSGVADTGAPVTLTAQVASTAGAPTGTVTFLDGSTVLGTAVVTPTGTATLTLSSLPTGVLSLTASYGGDANYVSSSSTAKVTQVQDFAITPQMGTPSVPVVPGASASFTLALTPGAGGFTSAITLTATGLPPGATYSFSPATLTPGSAVATTVLTVQTAKATTTARNLEGVAGLTLALLILPVGLSRKAREALKGARLLSVIGAVVLLGTTAGLTGCGTSNGYFGQAGKSYTVTVTATSGNLVHSTQVVVNVQ